MHALIHWLRCPTCSAGVLVATHTMLETTTTRLFRCPACRLIACQARP